MRAWVVAMLIGMLPLAGLAQPAPGPAPAPPPGAATGASAAPEAAGRQRSAAQQAQQERMRACNTEATTRGIGAEARRSFMRECLAGRPPAPAGGEAQAQAAPAPVTQQDRMRRCNADASGRDLAGEPRRQFMRECLSGGTTPAAGRGAALANNATTFSTEAAARAACADDTVVWGNADSRVFHMRDSRFYGKTQNGAYLCRSPAELAGYRAAR